ncbi:MAG TPA: NAD(P)H-binding protein [Solirubrobacteraceae bacterium]|nr:NAD(P)H-binding protein [Solirubrobacteraceae bacterium]
MNERRKIAVVGATGRLGAPLVEVLEGLGDEVVSISRSQGVNVITGEGLEDALTGVDTVIDAASAPSPEQDAATEFFLTATRNIQEACERAGVQQVVLVSIIGVDRFAGGGSLGGYYVAKVAQEQAYREGSVPTRILRAAQFHEFVGQLLEWGTQGDAAQVPAMNTQLVAARDVAEALAEMARSQNGSEPDGAIPEIAGPRPERLVEMARLVANRRGGPARVEEVDDQDDPDRDLFVGDGLLPGPDAKLVGPTFEEWLDARNEQR